MKIIVHRLAFMLIGLLISLNSIYSAPLSGIVNTTKIKCQGGADGTATIVASGGTGTYTYLWYNPSNALIGGNVLSITNLSLGNNYRCRVNDGSTVINVYFDITENPGLFFDDLVATNPLCNGGSGSIVITAIGGTSPYTYSVDGGVTFQASNTFSVTVGSYDAILQDNLGCLASYTSNPIVITAPSAISVTTTHINLNCNGASNGSITITASGGTGALSYSIDNGVSYQTPSNIFNSLPAGTYQVKVKDANNCETTASAVTLTEPAALSATLTPTNVTGCFGNSNGAINITLPSGGSGAFEYTINGGTSWQGSGSYTNLIAGTYNVQMRDKNTPTCVKILNAALIITQPLPHTATINITNIPCPESGNVGAISFVGTSGGPSGNYDWTINNGTTWNLVSPNFTNLAPGNYNLKIRDGVNTTCITNMGIYTITRPNPLTFTTLTPTDITCNGNNNGTITAVASGGTTPYTYTLKLGAAIIATNATGSFTNLAPGTYTLTVKDNVPACTSLISSNIVLAQPAILTVTVTPNPATACVNVALPLTATPVGGNGGNTYAWTAPTGGSFNNPTSQTPNYTHNVAGAFTASVTVTDSKGCTVNGSTNITVTPNATITLTSPAGTDAQTKCINTAITNITYAIGGSGTGASVVGLPAGVSGSFAAGVFTISGAPTASGTFNYTVTATGTCAPATALGTITVTPNATITLTSAVGTNAQTKCINTAITNITYAIGGSGTGASVIGLPAGVSGSFAAGVFTISGTPTASGTFNYTVTATGACAPATALGTITVTPNATISLTSAVGTDAQTKCINTAITNITYAIGGSGTGATVVGLPAGVTGSFAAGVFTISGTPSASGTFNYTVSTTGPCNPVTALGTITVTPNATITLTSSVGTNAQTKCINTAITNITYAIGGSGTGATVVGLPAGVSGAFAAGVFTISGTPTASGTFNYTVTATGTCAPATALGTITVTPNATITLTSAAGTDAQTKCINTAITNITYAIGGSGTGASVVGLPAGVSGAFAAGVFTISGTPTASGTFSYTVTATGTCAPATALGTITVTPNATITMTSAVGTDAQTKCINTAIANITYAIGGSGTGASVVGLPAGVSGAFAAGVFTISGTPTASGTFNYTVTATGTCASATALGTITVTPNATITLTSAVGTDAQTKCINTAITNITYSIGGSGTGASVVGLPAGVSGAFAAGVFTISGTPTASGTFNYTVTATGTCAPATALGTITVTPNATITLTSAAGTDAQTNCINTAITNITYAIGGSGTGATVVGLPAGVTGSFAAGIFTISGTPTASGTFSYTVSTTGPCNPVTALGTITVTPNATITLTSAVGTNAQTKCINTAITNITYAIGGSGTGASVVGLPAGVSGAFAAGVFTISGTPTASGTFSYTVTATGSCAPATALGTITVTPNATITLTSAVGTDAQTKCLNTAITNITYTIGGSGTGATVVGLPAGVTGSFTAGVFTISGTPTASGTFNYTVSTTGPCNPVTALGTITVTPNATITLTSAVGTDAQTKCVNTAITNITYAIGGSGTGASVVGLPAGVSGTFAAGVFTISGTPTASGTFSYTVTATGTCAPATALGTITVTPNATITLTSAVGTDAQTKCINAAITNITYAIGGSGTGASVVGLPAGVSGSFAAGVFTISGTPTASGTFNYTVTATGTCAPATALGTITVTPNATITLTSAVGTDAQTKCVNTAITNITYAIGGSGTGASVVGLPAGVSGAFAAGVFTISGTPTASGTFNYTVTATGTCASATALGTITVTPNATITLTSAAGTDAQTKCINTAITNITYAIGGSGTGASVVGLPAGVSGAFAAGVFTISGTPTASGTFNYTVTATGTCAPATALGTITVTPNATITLTSAVGTDAQTKCVNTAITNITYAIGGSGTGASVVGLPAGVSGAFAAGVFTISGTPTASGTFNYTVTATGTCAPATALGTITVTPNATITLTSAAGTDAQTKCINTAITSITYSIGGSGTGATVVGLPAGVTGSFAAGVFTISGTPTASGTFSYTVSTTGPCNPATALGTITVTPDATITLTSAAGTDAQTKCVNTAITNITYAIGGSGTGASVVGLPAGVSGAFAAGVFTISGTPTASGTFSYTVSTAGPCAIATSNGTITVNPIPDNTFTVSDPTVCYYEDAIINVSSSEMGITYVLQDIADVTVAGPVIGTGAAINFTLIANALTVGTFNYHVLATTATGCSVVLPDLAIVTKRAEVTFTFTSTDVTCNGLGDGKINVTAANGNVPYTVSIDNGLTFPYSTGVDIIVGTGNYQIIVKDANNCLSAMQSVTIIEPSALTATTSVTNIVCYGATDGIIDITAIGGTSPYEYSIDGGTTFFPTNIFNSLIAGTYNIVVRDFNSCTFATTAIITEPLSPPLDNIIVTDIKCYGESTGAIQMIPNLIDYPGPFQYSIDGGTTYTTTDKFTGLPKGVYTVFYKSGAGTCIYSDVAPVSEPPEISVTSLNKTDLVCGGAGDGSISVTAISFNVVNDPLTVKYSIDGGPYGLSGTFIGLSGGDHIVSMINDSLCVKNITVNLTEPASITLSTPVVTDISCFAASADGSISVTASGGILPYLYTLKQGATIITSNGVGLFTGLSAGSYTVEGSDAGTCPPILSGVLTIIEPPIISITGQTFENIKCFGGTGNITISAIGGTNPLVYNLFDGTHTLVTSNGIGNFDISFAGTYTVEVTDANSCGPQIAGPFIITVPAELKIISQSFTQITAAGASDGTITILASGGTGTSLIYTLNPLDPMNPMAGVALTPGVGIPAIFTGLSADTYTVVIIDDNSCTVVSDPVVLGMIDISLTATQTTCKKTNDGQISLSIIGGNAPYTITWAGRTLGPLPAFDNLTSITGLAPDWYIAKVVDVDGLSIKDSLLITDPQILTVSIDTAKCSYLKETRDDVGRIEILSTTRGIGSDLTFKWNYPPTNPNMGLVIDSISSGNYKVTVTDVGCTYDSSFHVPYDPKYYMNAYAVKDTNICYGVSLDLKAITNGPLYRTYNYSWYKIPETAGVPLSKNTTFRVSPKDSSKYYLEIRNDGFCFSADTVMVGVYPDIGLHVPLYISAIQEDTIISILSGTTYNMDVNVANTKFPTTFRWEPSMIFIPPDSWNSGIYIDDVLYSQLPKVEIFDPKIRRNSTYIPIKAIAETSVGCSDTLNLYAKLVNKISFGNVFSPNGDGLNDTWIVPKEYLFPDLEIEIFNRWGALVWSAKGDKASKGWNGRTNGGNELPIGTYYYVIKYNIQSLDGNWKPITGSVTIVR